MRESRKDATNTEQASDGMQDKLVSVRRTAKVVKGGRIFGFSAVMVTGDGQGRIGVGSGKAREVPIAINKAKEDARRNMVQIDLKGTTLQHPVKGRHGATRVLMLPAEQGTGIIAGSAMRAVFEVMGVKNVFGKSLGSTNPLNVVQATIKGLLAMSSPESVAAKRGKSVEDIVEE